MKIISFSEPGQTPIDEDEKLGLIPNLNTLEELNNWEHENIIEGRKWALNSRVLNRNDIFNSDFILKLHKKMFDKAWKWAGTLRTSGKNIGCEPYEIRGELKKLYDDVSFWIENKTYTIEQVAIIFHHRLVKIHIFPNGNGRHARLAADCIMKKFVSNKKIEWGSEISGKFRRDYIVALQKADKGNYQELFDLFLR